MSEAENTDVFNNLDVGISAMCNGNPNQTFRIALYDTVNDEMFNHFDTSVS